MDALELKSAVSMLDVLARYQLEPKRGFIVCPFHDEKTASLKIYPNNKGWHCFGCGRGGSVIDFVMQIEGVDFKAACQLLCGLFGLEGNGNPVLQYRHKFSQHQRKVQRSKKDDVYQKYLKCLDIIRGQAPTLEWTPELEWACLNVDLYEHEFERLNREELDETWTGVNRKMNKA